MATTHEQLCLNPAFTEMWYYRRTFSFREHGRNFNVGDFVELCEYDSYSSSYTGRKLLVLVTYVTPSLVYCLKDDYIVFSFKIIKHLMK